MLIENRFAGNYYVYQFEERDCRLIVLKDIITVNHTFKPPQHYVKGLAPSKEKWWGKPEIEVLIEVNEFNKNSIRIIRIEPYRGEKFWGHDWETNPPNVDTHFTGDILRCKVCGITAANFIKSDSLSCDEMVIKDIIE